MTPHVVCIGVFDGVHRGHQALIAIARDRADALGLPLTAVTFDPDPMSVVHPHQAPVSLATLDQRIELLRAAGADEVHVLAFDEHMAAMEPREFVTSILIDRLGARSVTVGENFRFGHRAAGTPQSLAADGAELGFDVITVPLTGLGADRWSSTLIRGLLADGDVAHAAEVLGRAYRLQGVVVHGDHRGRELGFPTANVRWAGNPAIPADGVYAGWLTVRGETYPSAVSIGTNETFDGTERRVEAYALDRDDLDLYGATAWVDFVDRIRGQERFESADALVDRMAVDVEQARQILGRGQV